MNNYDAESKEKVMKGEDIKTITGKCFYAEEWWNKLSKEEQNKIREWVRTELKPIKSLNKKHSSYGLKHMCEKMVGFYVSNDMMKKALILEGYECGDTYGFNWHFNISEKSINKLLHS